ncbi:MAG: topoisomerase C-terminal repeat-containing protein, partial [Steroidobacteraceae bacterium]
RMGRFGPFVQAGTKDDVEKPKFAGLRPGQKMDTLTLEQALVLFQLPRKIGETADGEPISVAVGRFGPYVKYGSKYVSLKDPDDPYTVTLERTLEVIEAKKVADANRTIQDFGVDDIQVLNGRYGPYITDKARNARIPKDRDPKTLTLEECRALLAAAPPRPARGRFGRRGAPAKGKTAAAAKSTPDKAAADKTATAKAKKPAAAKARTKAAAEAPATAVPAKAKARPKAKAKAKTKPAPKKKALPAATV